jgi:hypothetical protein
MKEDLHKKIGDTLNSLDGLQRAEANPFLAAKIWHRVQEAGREPVVPAQWSWRLAVVMIVFLILNLITAQQVMQEKEDNSGANAVATDYSISLPQAY